MTETIPLRLSEITVCKVDRLIINYSNFYMCSVLYHWRGIGLLVNPFVYMYVCVLSWVTCAALACSQTTIMYICLYVFCLGSLVRYWLARKPEYIYVCVCSVLYHWRGIGLLVNPFVYMYVCVLSWVTCAALACSQTTLMYICLYVFCLGSLVRYWLARKPEYIYVCVCILSWVTSAVLACSQT